MSKIPVGISACLLGENVRYDSGHKRSQICTDLLSSIFDFHAFCPEVAIGMGVPRETIKLVGIAESPRAVGTRSRDLDVTDALAQYGTEIGEFSKQLFGYILKERSPSCALSSAKIYMSDQLVGDKHAGIYVRHLRNRNPDLPLVEEVSIRDPQVRRNFVTRVLTFYDWHKFALANPSPRALVEFHSRYKYLVMAHGNEAYKMLGRLVASAGSLPLGDLYATYLTSLMKALSVVPSRSAHANVLFHLLGYLKGDLSGVTRRAIVGEIEEYQRGNLGLESPLSEIRHYLSVYGSEYINSQCYLSFNSEESANNWYLNR